MVQFQINRSSSTCHTKQSRGFSLIELLVVIAIIASLAVSALPAFQNITSASNLSSASLQVTADFTLARQLAISRSQVVEVRLYQSSDDKNYRMMAVVIPDTDRSSPPKERLTKVRYLPGQVIFDSRAAFSSLLQSSGNGTDSPYAGVEASTNVPSAVKKLPYLAISFRPDGSSDVDPSPSTPWTLSLRDKNATSTSDRPANNFITLRLDPVVGRWQSFQP